MNKQDKSLSVLPNARAMEVFPYLHILVNQEKLPQTVCEVSGNGFVTDALSEKLNAKFTVEPAFENFSGKYDLVIVHGGLRYAVVKEGDQVSRQASNKLQAQIVRQLVQGVNPGGILIIADVPAVTPWEYSPFPLKRTGVDKFAIDALARESDKDNLHFALSAQLPSYYNKVSEYDILRANKDMHARMDIIGRPAPKFFLDKYVAQNTVQGHVASYPNFGRMDHIAGSEHMSLIFRMNVCTPWIFDDEVDAGWFMREKLGIGTQTARPGQLPAEDWDMYNTAYPYLGTRQYYGRKLTNWGMTYSAWQR